MSAGPRHPANATLSLATGHRHAYSEGAAYRGYFGTDDRMFPGSRRDDRLANKEEVLVLRPDDPARGGQPAPLASTARFLARKTDLPLRARAPVLWW